MEMRSQAGARLGESKLSSSEELVPAARGCQEGREGSTGIAGEMQEMQEIQGCREAEPLQGRRWAEKGEGR